MRTFGVPVKKSLEREREPQSATNSSLSLAILDLLNVEDAGGEEEGVYIGCLCRLCCV